jgi:MFS family permease
MPIIGFITDKIGKRHLFLFLTAVILYLAYGMLLLDHNCNTEIECIYHILPSLILFGCFFGIFSGVIFAGVPLVVRKNIIGTAMGIEVGLNNLGNYF